ncbi:hypothetical protein HIM_08663 [Hirsutella minnesotensis 3608]|uniref:Uncharacterized protein n=1 Tax=Hirsutella minnesotensis 3608 TaxID=1043627 RepID=A0A0F7ZSU7_9HYPO|nr:hypothetical protein HIM_08663 [Hirsutella minnesotensis 3608]
MSSSSPPNNSPHPSPHQKSCPSATSIPRRQPDPRRDTFPFSFHQPCRANPSSTSLVPSTAEGKPIPLDDSTTENRTSALREINHHYPSRHRYAKSSGAQSSTYSEPVIVRSYHPVASSRRPAGSVKADRSSHAASASLSGLDAAGPGAVLFSSRVSSAGSGMLGTMARARAAKVSQVQQETRLPPVEAFTFKSFMANLESQGEGGDINADLDRIAEICAKSRYSLSNQYEVHYAPHGSGASFLAATQQSQELPGPTLQVVSSDDEHGIKRQRRPLAGRRNSRAMGTLETIMSSSRSSDEEKCKQKSAAELADQVRGRASWKDHGTLPVESPSRDALQNADSQDENNRTKAHARRPSYSLALIDNTRQRASSPDTTGVKPSNSGLVGEPALPQASTSQLELRTASGSTPVKHSVRVIKITAPPSTVLVAKNCLT